MMERASGGKSWDAARYDQSHSYVWQHGAGVVDLLAPQPGERILDLGCGTGHLTAKIAESGSEVVGLDSSPEMVEQARGNYPHLRFIPGDAADFRVNGRFDAVFSNAVLHWVKNAEGVVGSVREALKPGGRFVAEFGGRDNIAGILQASHEALTAAGSPPGQDFNPWYFPSTGEYATLLERHGFRVTFASHFDRSTALDGGEQGMANWLEMFGSSFLKGLSTEVRAQIIRGVEERLRPTHYREDTWYADYVRLRVVAVKRP